MRVRVWVMLIGVFAPLVSNAADLSIQSQPLGTSLQELAQQSGIQIIFFSRLVEGQQAPALKGALTPEAALEQLLAGTDLTYRVLNERAIEVTVRPKSERPSTATTSVVDTIDEVEVNAQLARLGELRAAMERLEEQFYAKYNELNADPEYDIQCKLEARTGTHVLSRTCQPEFATRLRVFGPRRFFYLDSDFPERLAILTKIPGYQQNMVEVVRKHPELLELLKQRDKLARRYEAARQQKLKKKSSAHN